MENGREAKRSLARYVRETAQWRMLKAPEDPRSASTQSAEALFALSLAISRLPDDHPRLVQLAALYRGWDVDAIVASDETHLMTARYGYLERPTGVDGWLAAFVEAQIREEVPDATTFT